MRQRSACARPAGWIVLLALLAGCSTTFHPADASRYVAMSCNELNTLLSTVSSDLSRTAINRGNVERTNIPGWVLGGRKVATAVVDRQTARIEKLQQEERAIAAARDRTCGRRQ